MKQVKPKIDTEIQGALTAPHAEEFAQLKANLEEYGQREPGVVWKETGLLLDGHTRLKACEELGIPFKYTTLSFDSKQEAMEWVWKNQLGRRNLAKTDRDFLITKRYVELKKKKKDTESQGEADSHSDSSRPNVAKEVAAEAGVSEATVHRAVSNFCVRCTRTGMPMRDCKECAKLRAKKGAKKKAKASPKKGSALIDWAGFEAALGVVIRLADRMKDHYKDKLDAADEKEYRLCYAEITRIKSLWKKAST